MGVNGLLKYASPAICKANVWELRGRPFAVDMSIVIHKALAPRNSDAYMEYCELYLKRIKSNDVTLVFDGRAPIEKREELDARAKNYTNYTGMPHMTREIVHEIEKAFEGRYKILHAPGESDSQLAYLANTKPGLVVVTDDSDLIVYGCETIVFKLNVWGCCHIYEKERLPLKIEWPVFRWACILAGCDYLRAGYPGFGVIKAIKFMESFAAAPSLDEMLAKLPKCPDGFKEKFLKAENVFLHQSVMDAEGCVVPLTLIEAALEPPALEEARVLGRTPEEVVHGGMRKKIEKYILFKNTNTTTIQGYSKFIVVGFDMLQEGAVNLFGGVVGPEHNEVVVFGLGFYKKNI